MTPIISNDSLNPKNNQVTTKAINIGIIAIGGGGNNIGESFFNKGYKVLFLNTSQLDLNKVSGVDKKFKQKIGGSDVDGSGKDMNLSFNVFTDSDQIIYKKIETVLDNVDKIFIVATTGGGAGAGGIIPVIRVTQKYLRDVKNSEKIGVITTIPKRNEVKNEIIKNDAFVLLSKLSQLSDKKEISPLMIVNNEQESIKIKKAPIKKRWRLINDVITSNLDLVNTMPCQVGEENFDKSDLIAFLNSGHTHIIKYVENMDVISELGDNIETDLPERIKTYIDSPENKHIYDINPDRDAYLVGTITICNEELLDEQEGLMEAIEAVGKNLTFKSDGKLFNGIYPTQEKIFCMVVILGGFTSPNYREILK